MKEESCPVDCVVRWNNVCTEYCDFGNISVDGKIILKWALKKYDVGGSVSWIDVA